MWYLCVIVFVEGGACLNNRLKDIRKWNRLTQEEFAKRIGITQSTVTAYECANRVPSDSVILNICREFGVNEVWLRTGEGEPFQEETREEQIFRAAAQTIRSSNEFRKQLAFWLAQLDESDWVELEKIYRKLAEQKK